MTTPADEILRTFEYHWSDTYKLPALSMVKPVGVLNLAAVPVPSVLPAVPAVPAKVVTTPELITTLRITWLDESATNRLVPSVAIPAGLLNVAAVPVPLAEPTVPTVPAKVVTAPAELMTRMVWFKVSVI